jgi:hypothetical protein
VLSAEGENVTIQTAEGGCLCGAVRYRVTARPVVGTLCHCRTCRLACGAPSVAWTVFHSRHFAFITGEPSVFHSSPTVLRTFCGRCGTSLTYQRSTQAETIDITTATLDSPDDFAPTKEIWTEQKLGWESLNGNLAQYPRSSVGV